jgi:hypothetical protein
MKKTKTGNKKEILSGYTDKIDFREIFGDRLITDPEEALFLSESGNSPFWALLRGMGYSDFELAIMNDFKSIVPIFVFAVKNKGVRFEISDIENGDIISLDKDIVIFRGRAGKLLYDLCKGSIAGLT